MHVETAGPGPLKGEILSVHAMRVDKRRPVAEFHARVLPLRALTAGPLDVDPEAGRPAAKKPSAVPLQEAIAGLCTFLGTHRQYVFTQ